MSYIKFINYPFAYITNIQKKEPVCTGPFIYIRIGVLPTWVLLNCVTSCDVL